MWTPKNEFPDLSRAKYIGLDSETKDPFIKTLGAGYIRHDGYPVGVSIATLDGFRAYYPIAHEDGGNVEDRGQVIRYLRDQLRGDQPKVGAYIGYDLGWLRTLGVHVGGKKIDVAINEALIDENYYSYSLDSIAMRHLGLHKEEPLLQEAAIKYGVKNEKDIKANLWRFHSQYVGPYAETDAELPIQVFEKQLEILKEQDLMRVFDLECGLIDLLLEMKFRGVPVDLEGAEKAIKQLEVKEYDTQKEVNKLAGMVVDVWSNKSIMAACEKLNVPFVTTEKNNPSFTAEWLDGMAESIPLFGLIHKARKYNRSQTFITNSIINASVNGRIHCDFNQTKSDDKGTGTGRFSSSNPNLQQVPARDKEMAPIIRGLFIPEPGERWCKWDYSQQEPRTTVHFAYLRSFKGADVARNRYIEDPDTDYHQFIADLCSIERRPAKDINLGLAYGMGIGKMSRKLGKTLEETQEYFEIYHKNVPFVKLLSEECMRVANVRGYIKTILGRRRHFDLWVRGYKSTPLRYEEAVLQYGLPLKRFATYRALNSIIQGSCGDMMKLAMLTAYQEHGLVPYLTVHDELDDSVKDANDEKINLVQDVMNNAVKLEVPLKVDVECGINWGHLDKIKI